MNWLVAKLSGATGVFVELLLFPLSRLSPMAQLVVVSSIVGVLFLLVFGRVSPQSRIRATKREISASILETVLFRSDILLSLRAQWRIVTASVRYFLLAVPPILVLLIPCILILSQLQLYFGSRGFQPGERGVLEVELREGGDLHSISAEPLGVVELSPPVRQAEPPRVFWGLKAGQGNSDQPAAVRIRLGEQDVVKGVALKEDSTTLSKIFTVERDSPVSRLLYPVQPPVEAGFGSTLKEVSVRYPVRDYRLFGMKLDWVVVFFVVSLVAGFVASKVLRVEI